MKHWTTTAASSFVAIALLVPVGAAAQRHASPGTETGSSAGSRDGGDSGSSGSSGSGSVSPASMPSAPMPRTASESTGERSTRTATGRERGDRPQVGTAGSRNYPSNPGGAFQYQYTTRPIPYWWYSAYAPGFGFTSYDLWSWGLGSDLWWYRPYGYQPYYPYGFGLGSYGYGGGGGTWSEDRDDRPTGSIRLKVNPRDAKVYVDGALVGVVDEFDGLTNHLELDPGRHQLEVRASGYETFVADVMVTDGKTTTTRAKLKKTRP